MIRLLSNSGAISTWPAGFRGLRHAAVAVVVGVVLRFAIYAVQGAPLFNPVIILNAYAQALVVLAGCRGVGVLGCGGERLRVSAAGSREVGVRDLGSGHRQRPVWGVPLRS